jgi:RNA-binding protein YlmH
MNDSKYVHFRPEERPFVQKIEEWARNAAERHQSKRTDFLDPRQVMIVQSIVNRYSDVQAYFYGGYEGAERKVGWITPEYITPGLEESEVTAISIQGDTRFLDVDHGDYMGAILGLGIKRDKIGDILVHGEGCHLLTVKEIRDYILTHLAQVHRLQVSTCEMALDKLLVPQKQLEEMTFTIASLRLDAVASDVYRMSRAKILGPISTGKIKVNWKVTMDPSTHLAQGDVVSFKGFGRFELLEVEGPTKKGRIRVKIGKLK